MGTSISGIITVTTPPLGVGPEPATGLAVSSVSSNALTLSWLAPSIGSPPFTFQVQILPPGASAFQNTGPITPNVSAQITGLLTSSNYQFQVLTFNDTATSTSASVSAQTLSLAPSAPTGLAVSGTPGLTDIALQWAAPGSGSTPFTYQVFVSPTGTNVFTVAGPTTTSTFQDITVASGAYDFQVVATNLAGVGPASATLSNVHTAVVTNIIPSAPLNLTAGAITQSSLTVSWSPPTQGTPPLSYVLQYRLH